MDSDSDKENYFSLYMKKKKNNIKNIYPIPIDKSSKNIL